MTFIPSDIVVPIFGYIHTDKKWIFLGTGFFVGEPPLLATAGHILDKQYSKVGIDIAKEKKFYHASAAFHNNRTDLALLRIENYAPPFTCKISANATIAFNDLVCCYEYGTTVSKGKQIVLSPATRVGNITRILNKTETHGEAGQEMLELSFPALKGASGSPILKVEGEVYVLGVVVGNVSYHLHPVQIESILDEDNKYIEEVKYLLPQGLAVNSKHLLSFYSEIKQKLDHNH